MAHTAPFIAWLSNIEKHPAQTMLQFSDKIVSYETFINDLAARVVSMMKADTSDKRLFMSQAEAFRVFGQGNVRRWRRQKKIEPRKTPGKLEYPIAQLRELSRIVQDYL